MLPVRGGQGAAGGATDDLVADDLAADDLANDDLAADDRAADLADHHAAGDLADDPRLRAAAVAALTLGWGLFGAFVSHAAGLDDVAPDEAHAAVQSLARRIAGI
jgi:hypothetical protein